MSEYLTALKTTTHFKKKDSEAMLALIKSAADEWCGEYSYGWKPDVDEATNLKDVADALGIQLYYTDKPKDSVIPILNETYNTGFLKKMAEVLAPYMADGCIEGLCTEGYTFKVAFVGGRAIIKRYK